MQDVSVCMCFYICTCIHVYFLTYSSWLICILSTKFRLSVRFCFTKFSVVLRSYAFVVMLADFVRGFCDNSKLHKLSTDWLGMSYCDLHNLNHLQKTCKEQQNLLKWCPTCVYVYSKSLGEQAELCCFIILHPHISRLPPPVWLSTAVIVCSTQDLWNRV